jgi:hypothetical protein
MSRLRNPTKLLSWWAGSGQPAPARYIEESQKRLATTMKIAPLLIVLLLGLPMGIQPQSQRAYSLTAQDVLDDIKRVGTVWFSERDKAFSDHLTALTVELGRHPRIRSEYATLTAKPTDEQRQAWLAMLFVNAYYAGYARALNEETQKKSGK